MAPSAAPARQVAGGERDGQTRQRPPEPPAGHRRPTSPRPYATSCWSATPERARPRWSRRCSPRPAPITRAGRVEDGTTVTDFDEAEHAPAALGLASPWPRSCTAGVKVNLLDTPGYADFVGDLRAGLRAADAALFVVSAVDGVDGATRMLWEECAAVGMPRAVVVTKLDKERADFDEAVAICQRVFGDGVLPLYLPMAADDGTAGRPDRAAVADASSTTPAATRVEREPDPRAPAADRRPRATRSSRGSSPSPRTRP